MKKADALPFVSFKVDDTLNGARATGADVPNNARLVGWQCGFEPLFVAVYSYLPNVEVTAEEAVELAADYLAERGWFSHGPREPDFVI